MGQCISKMENTHSKDFYNLLLTQILQFMLKIQNSDEKLICGHRVLEDITITWSEYQKIYALLENLVKDLKTAMLIKLIRESRFTTDMILKDAKKFMSPKDYMDTLEKVIRFKHGSPRNYYDYCDCGRCNIDVPD